jgi:hypothetical protein
MGLELTQSAQTAFLISSGKSNFSAKVVVWHGFDKSIVTPFTKLLVELWKDTAGDVRVAAQGGEVNVWVPVELEM